MRLHDLKPNPGAKHRRKRLGCGESSGHGKTSGKGHKGQNARSGVSRDPAFEGGQMPLTRRVPKRGFSNYRFKTEYATINIDKLNVFEKNSVVTLEALKEKRIVKGKYDLVKILGEGDLNVALTVKVDKLSKSAYDKIIAAGGKIEEI